MKKLFIALIFLGLISSANATTINPIFTNAITAISFQEIDDVAPAQPASFTQELKKREALVGGEGNGGIIYPNVGWGRDSLVGITLALRHLAISKHSVSSIVDQYPQYVMLREKLMLSGSLDASTILEKLKKRFDSETVDMTDGIKIIRTDHWIHVRPSNTEPIIRIFIETPNLEQAKHEFKQIETMINEQSIA